jgi:peptidoglycan/LPS O-acetylase OafA/YrhL
VSLMGWLFLFPHEFIQLGRHILASAGLYENFLLLKEVNYFDRAAETKPLLHVWSLAVEEQFYLVWPLLLIFAKTVRLNFFWLATIIWIISLTSNLVVTSGAADRAFFLPWTRAWELMTGALIALAPGIFVAQVARHRNMLSILGSLLVVVGFLIIDKTWAFPGVSASLPTLGACILIAAGSQGWINKHVLAKPALIFIGKISYPLYLWHWPLFSFLYLLEGKDSAPELRALLILASFCLASITTYWIENPIRNNKRDRWPIWLLIMSMLTVVGIGFAIKLRVILPRANSSTTIKIANAVNDFDYPRGLQITSNAPTGIYETQGLSGGVTLILGDSHGMQYSSRIVKTTQISPEAHNKAIFATYSSCPPIPGVFTGWDESNDRPLWANEKACESIKQYAFNLALEGKVDVLVISGIWNGYFAGVDGTASGNKGYYVIRNKHRFPLETPEGVAAALENLRDFLNSTPKTLRTIIVLDNPSGQDFDPTGDVRNLRKPWTTETKSSQRVGVDPRSQKINNLLREIARDLGVETFDPSAYYCIDGLCQTRDESGRPIYRDVNHLTSTFIREQMTAIDGWISTQHKTHP